MQKDSQYISVYSLLFIANIQTTEIYKIKTASFQYINITTHTLLISASLQHKFYISQ